MPEETLVEKVELWKKEILSSLCFGICDGKCCRLNQVDWTEEQVRLIFGMKNEIIIPQNKNNAPILTKNCEGTYSTHFTRKDRCPQQDKDAKICRIHEHPLRPQACTDYPVWVEGNELLYHWTCPGTGLKYTADLFLFAIENNFRVFEMFERKEMESGEIYTFKRLQKPIRISN